jgi:hypothetical protein
MLYKTAHGLLAANHDEVNSSETPFVRIFPSLRIELAAGADRGLRTFQHIIPFEYNEVNFRDIRIYLRDNINISQTHALYMPLHYTTLFSNGDLGWHWGMNLTNDRDWLSQKTYHRFRLHQRSNE